MKQRTDRSTQQLKGVYSTPFEAKGKDGATRLRKVYWGAWVVGPDVYEIQPLNQNMVPLGQRQRISRLDFERQFTPEPDFFINRPSGLNRLSGPALRQAPGQARGMDSADWASSADAPDAPDEPAMPADVQAVSREMDALQTQGREQLKRGQTARAVDTFRRILALQGPFMPEHKFTFSGCGIDMRKAKQFEEAIAFHKKAMEVDETDEHLYHNIARALYDKGDLDLALEYLRTGLSMNPDFKEAKLFERHIEKRQSQGRAKARRAPINVDKPVGKSQPQSQSRPKSRSIDLDNPASGRGSSLDVDKPADGRPVSKKVYRF